MDLPPPPPKPQVQPCRYKTGKTLGSGSYSTVRECIHIDTGRYYAAKVITKSLMVGREHMVSSGWSYSRRERERERGMDGRTGTDEGETYRFGMKSLY